MRRRVRVRLASIMRAGDDLAIMHYHGTYGNLALGGGQASLGQRFAHKVLVIIHAHALLHVHRLHTPLPSARIS